MGKGSRNRNLQEHTASREVESTSRTAKILTRIGLIVLAVAIIFVFIFAILHSTGILQRNLTAMQVGDMKISSMDFNIYYTDYRNNFLNNYGSQLQQYGYDITSIDSQICIFDQTKTWREYFNEQVEAQITETSVLYQEAQANGFEMPEDAQEDLQTYMDSYNDAAESNGMTVEEYVKAAYSSKTKLSDIQAVYDVRFYSNAYYDYLYDSNTFTDEDIETYYQEHKDEYDLIDYRSFSFPYETYTYTAPAEGEELEEGAPASEEEAEQMTEAALQEAKAQAEEMLSRITDENSFEPLAEEYFEARGTDEEFTTTLHTRAAVSEASGSLGEWCTDESRQYGDTTVIEDTESGQVDVVFFINRYRDESNTVDVRHALFQVTEITDDMTEQEKNMLTVDNEIATTKAQELYDQWVADGATEEDFIVLAQENSEDSSASNGGLYENVAQGEMVEEFDDWCFDPSRQPGDHGLIQTEYGYHIMYFVGKSDKPKYYADIETTLKDEAYAAMYEEFSANYAVDSNQYAISLSY